MDNEPISVSLYDTVLTILTWFTLSSTRSYTFQDNELFWHNVAAQCLQKWWEHFDDSLSLKIIGTYDTTSSFQPPITYRRPDQLKPLIINIHDNGPPTIPTHLHICP